MLIYDIFPLFIEVGCLKNKLNKIRYELECIVIPKNSKRIGFYLNQKVPRPGLKFVLIGTCHVSNGTPRVPTGPLGCRAPLPFFVRFELSFEDFLSWELHLDVFLTHILKLIFFYLDNLVFKVIII